MTDALKRSPEGWWLPKDDTVFEQYASPPEFRVGPPPKRGGFYRGHLLAAFPYVRAWDCAIDVGGHCGYWSYEMAQRFAMVHAFEPSPANYQCLLKNVAEFENVQTYNLAVGNKLGRCAIQNDKKRPGNSGSNYIVPGAGDVEIVMLDSKGFPACDFLKVDVEGFELRVLEGARELIKRFRPVISMECTDFKFRDRYDIPEGQAERWLSRGVGAAARQGVRMARLKLWCAECKINPARDLCKYMLVDELWAMIAKPDDNLCLECAEKRLGRALVPADFAAGGRVWRKTIVEG